MAWSNIFCQIITPAGPIIGEGLISGWQTSIELTGFDWGLTVQAAHDDQSFGSAMKKAALTALPIRPVEHDIQDRNLTLKKRFDIASSDMHMMMDLQVPIISVSITVLHISPSSQTFHLPGFVILCTDCKIKSVDVNMQRATAGVDVMETVVVEYGQIVITYLRALPGPTGDVPLPMPPFIYARKTPPPAMPSL